MSITFIILLMIWCSWIGTFLMDDCIKKSDIELLIMFICVCTLFLILLINLIWAFTENSRLKRKCKKIEKREFEHKNNYVTLNTEQEIIGLKTFGNDVKIEFNPNFEKGIKTYMPRDSKGRFTKRK